MALSPAAEAQRRYRAKHPGRSAEISRKAAAKKRRWVMEHKASRGCGVCGETDPVVLELHHLDPADKTHNSGWRAATNWIRLTWELLELEVSKCDVLCANCHRRETAKERGWYSFMEGEE